MDRRSPHGKRSTSPAHAPHRAYVLAAALAAALALLSVTAPARAAPIDVIRDCSEDGSLDGNYSQKELEGALDELPSDLDEYTDCRSVIRRAQLASAHGKKGGGRKGAVAKVDPAKPPSSREERELREATGGHEEPVEVGGKRVQPGQSGAPFAAAGLGTDLPTPVLIVLVALGLAMLTGGAYAVQRRWPAAAVSVGEAARKAANGVRRGISRRR